MRPIEEIRRDIENISHRMFQSVEMFRDMSSQLAQLGRTMVHNWALMEKVLNELSELKDRE